jgi:hypothetical protein
MKKQFRLPKQWQKNKIQQSASTEMKKADFVLPQAPERQSSSTYHHSCKTLCIDPFLNAYCNNDLSGLLISGTPDPSELQDAWNEIMFDYSGLIKTDSSNNLFLLQREIAILEHHIIYIDYAIPFLKLKYDEDIANEVRMMGYDIPEGEGYQKALDLIKELAKRKVFDHGNLVDEYNRLNKTVEGKKQTEEEFIKTILMLAKYQGYAIDRKTTTVFDFAQIFNNYLAEMKVKEKQMEKWKT